MPRGSLEVSEFVPRQSASDAGGLNYALRSATPGRHSLNRMLTSGAAALVVLTLHVAVIAPFWRGGGSEQRQEQRYRGETALQWMVLEQSPTTTPVRPASLPSAALASISVSAALMVLPSVSPPAPSARDADAQSQEQLSAGALYGRYVGQIRARIDRAWRRPRTAIGAPIFQCQVQIDQDSLGQVGDVTLVECNGDARWQLSLIRAIEAASPLPAPPDPAVFTRHVLLEFRARAYSPEAPAALYEPPRSLVAAAGQPDDARETQNAFQALRQAAAAPNPNKALQLRIEGSKVEVEPDRQ